MHGDDVLPTGELQLFRLAGDTTERLRPGGGGDRTALVLRVRVEHQDGLLVQRFTNRPDVVVLEDSVGIGGGLCHGVPSLGYPPPLSLRRRASALRVPLRNESFSSRRGTCRCVTGGAPFGRFVGSGLGFRRGSEMPFRRAALWSSRD